MTSLERAKALAQKVGKLGLKIVPLAVVAIGAHAAVIAPQTTIAVGPQIGGATATSCPGGGSIISSSFSNADGVNGIKLYTGTSCTSTNNASGGAVSLLITASGNGAGTAFPFTILPVNLSFTPTFSTGGTLTYSFTVNLNGSANSPQLSGTVPSGTLVSQTLNYNLGPNFSLTSWSVALAVSGTAPGTLNVMIPQNSIDLNANTGTNVGVPEPSAALLLLPATGLLLLRRRKLKA